MRSVSLLLMIAMLSGCYKVGPNYRKPQVEIPQTWRFAEQNAQDTSNLPWWEQFGDPVLNRLVEERGIQNNLDLKIAIANVEQFMGQYGATRANLFPQIIGFGEYARHQPSIAERGVKTGDTDFTRLGAEMQWKIDVWGKLRRAKEAAKNRRSGWPP